MSGPFFDHGYEHHKAAPDLLLAEVWRVASHRYKGDRISVYAFMEGYRAARKQREEAQAEGTP